MRTGSRSASTHSDSVRRSISPCTGEKWMAAARAGVACVLLPRRNAKDLPEVPAEVREKLEIVLVDTIEEALERALEPAAERGVSS